MNSIIFILGIVIAVAIGIIIGMAVGMHNTKGDDGVLYIYPDEQGRMCTVASFTKDTVSRLRMMDPTFKVISMDIQHLDGVTRNNIASYNEESSTNIS